jgi:hypothetical protein
MKPNIEIVANWWFCSLKFSYTKDLIPSLTLVSPATAAPLVASLVAPIVYMAAVQASIVQATVFGGVAGFNNLLMPRLVESYKKILVIACEEASEWSMSNPRSDVDLTCLESAALERVLQKRGMPIHVWIFALLQ